MTRIMDYIHRWHAFNRRMSDRPKPWWPEWKLRNWRILNHKFQSGYTIKELLEAKKSHKTIIGVVQHGMYTIGELRQAITEQYREIYFGPGEAHRISAVRIAADGSVHAKSRTDGAWREISTEPRESKLFDFSSREHRGQYYFVARPCEPPHDEHLLLDAWVAE